MQQPIITVSGDPEIKVDGSNIPIATAVPAAEACHPIDKEILITGHQEPLSDYQIRQLQQEKGFPLGLAQELGNTRARYPIRFWIIDNSGSMRASDGHQLRSNHNNSNNYNKNNQQYYTVPCTRWKELQNTVEYHVELAAMLEATTFFRMLNDPPGDIPQEFSIAEPRSSQSLSDQVHLARHVLANTEPRGVTPLIRHLQEIRQRITSIEHILRERGQEAVIVMASDGLPSDERGRSPESIQTRFVDALRELQELPVWIVIRLCTDSEEVVEFYNRLDQVLELPIEVIDDYLGECQEIVAAGNAWLNYALPLHACREMGVHHRIFDLLDERLLNKDEVRELLDLLLGNDVMLGAPDIHTEWKAFQNFLANVLQNEGKQWNPNTRKMDYWIDMKQLNKTYGNKGFRLFGRSKVAH